MQSGGLTGSDVLAILEPFNPHEGVTDRLQLTLKVGIFSLQNLPKVGQRLDKGWLNGGVLFNRDGALEA